MRVRSVCPYFSSRVLTDGDQLAVYLLLFKFEELTSSSGSFDPDWQLAHIAQRFVLKIIPSSIPSLISWC